MRDVSILLVVAIFIFLSVSLSVGQTPLKKTPELLIQGKTLYEKHCVACHGNQGDGNGKVGKNLKPPASDFTKPFDKWEFSKGDMKRAFNAITNGIPNTAMAKFDHLSEKECWALTYAVVEFATSSKKTPEK